VVVSSRLAALEDLVEGRADVDDRLDAELIEPPRGTRHGLERTPELSRHLPVVTRQKSIEEDVVSAALSARWSHLEHQRFSAVVGDLLVRTTLRLGVLIVKEE